MLINPKHGPELFLMEEVVTCAVIVQKHVLVLKRHLEKPHGDQWCLPGGKCERGYSSVEAEGLRELFEETGIRVDTRQVCEGVVWFIRYPEGDFIYHQIVLRLDSRPTVRLHQPEHTDYRWVTWSELLKLPYIEDLDEVLKRLLA